MKVSTSQDLAASMTVSQGLWFLLVLVLPVIASAQSMSVANPAAVIVRFDGEVLITRRQASTQDITQFDLIYPADTLETGPDSTLQIRFTDETLLELGPSTRLTIENQFRHPASATFSVLNVQLERGTTRWVTRTAGVDYQLVLPHITVSDIAPNTSFELVQTASNESVLSVYDGQLSARHDTRLMALAHHEGDRVVVADGTQMTRRSTDTGLPLRGPLPEPERRMRLVQWSWLFEDTGPLVVDGVLSAASLSERDRRRSPLPPPAPVPAPTPRFPVPETEPAVMPEPTPVPGPEAEPEPLAEDQRLLILSSLIRNRQDVEAYNLAMSMRQEFEGEPDYDILFARAAMNQGEYQRAAFALERSLITYPSQIDVRLMLVEAYLGLRNTSAARRQLDRLAERTLSARQQGRWDTLDARLRRQLLAAQQSQSFSLGAELQYYTNINNGVGFDETSLPSPAGSGTFSYSPDENAQAQAAPAILLQGSYTRTTPMTQRLRRNLQVGVTTRQSTVTEAANVGGLLSLGLEHSNGRSGALQLIPSWTPDSTQATLRATGSQRDIYHTLDLGISVGWTLADTQSANASAQLSDEVMVVEDVPTVWSANTTVNFSENELQNYIGVGGAVSPRYQGPYNLTWQGLVSTQLQMYTEEDGLYGDRRRNLVLQLETQVFRPLSASSLLTGRATYLNTMSNQSLYSSSGFEIALGYQQTW